MPLAGLVLVMAAASPLAANAASRGSLWVATSGLPSGQRASMVARGTRFFRIITTARASLRGLRPGRYVIKVKPVTIGRARNRVRAGATAYPARPRIVVKVRAGKTTRLAVVYSAVVNPGVRPLPSSVLGVIGDPKDPSAVVLPGRMKPPRVGTIFTSGPTPMLPYGLVSKVTRIRRRGNKLVVSLSAVPISEAVPELSFTGSLALRPSSGATQELASRIATRSARTSAGGCGASRLLKFAARLNSVELRQAFLGAWPPQMRLKLAVRTTESLGVAAAAVGLNCDWTLGEIGPYQAGIPVGPVVIPVYATLPVKTGIHVNGTLNVGTINVASTTVAAVAAGFDESSASLTQQGSNVWVTGAPSVSGSAKLSASIGLQAGIGIAKGANVHLEADFGPELDWSSGQSCNLLLNFGSLSAGVAMFGKHLNTPSFTPWQLHLWSGCNSPGGGGGGPGGGGGGASGATQIAAGGEHTCALLSGGSIDCWGNNGHGELGDGTTNQSDVPVAVSGIG